MEEKKTNIPIVTSRDDDTDREAREEYWKMVRRLRGHHPAIKSDRIPVFQDEDDEEVRRAIRLHHREFERWSDMIVRPVTVDTSLSAREIINRFGDRQIIETGAESYLDSKEREPERELREMMVYFFWVKRFKSFRDIAQQYIDRGLIPHLRAVGTLNITDHRFAYDYPNNVWIPGWGLVSFIYYKVAHEVFATRGWTLQRKGRRVDVVDASWWGGVKLESILAGGEK